MADSLWVPTYFKAHASLSAYMNILRRNLSTTCITRQTVACDITAVDPIRKYGIADVRVFWSKLPIKVENKTQERWFSTAKYSAMFVTVRAKWLWTSKKIMFSHRVKLEEDSWRGAVVIKGGRRLYGNWHFLCINTPLSGSGYQRTPQWSTSQHVAEYADGRSWQR